MKKKTSLFKLLITILVIYFVINSIFSLFKKEDDEEEHTNSYVTNHSQTFDTEPSDVEVDYEVSSNARSKFTKIIGDNKDEVTIMIYMIGTDLESQSGMATRDINEMLRGKIGDNTNVVLETGGCSRWNNSVFSNKNVERWVINSNNFSKLKEAGRVSMTDPNTLTEFIKYSASNFPANRYMLILWDHGGGSVSGYGYDENYPNSGSLSPDLLGKALRESGIKFDIVGFDACLMANLETAIAIEPYADYMIASEETEPGEGWLYTNWINMIENNTSTSSLDLGKQIINDYVNETKNNHRTAEATQSIIDLGELVANIKKPLVTFSKATSKELEGDNYQSVAIARGNAKEFSSSSHLDQVDFIDLVNKIDVDGSKELADGLKAAIKYNKTYNINNSYGLSVYFPYSSMSKVNSMIKIHDDIDMDENFTSVIKSFATYASSGHIITQNSNSTGSSLLDLLTGSNYYSDDSYYGYDYSDMLNDSYYGQGNYGYGYEDSFGYGYDSWMDNSALGLISSFFRNKNIINPSNLNVVNKNNQNVVSLSDDDWNLIDRVLLNVFVDDGEGYLDLGKDNTFEWNKAGDLIVDCDGTWLAVNEHVVSYEFDSDMYVDENNFKTVGHIPAYLNSERVDLIVNFTPENRYGVILGAKKKYDVDTEGKGLIDIKDGDELIFVCNYYSYTGELIDEYQIGEPLIVDGELRLDNVYLDNDYVYAYCLTDIYGANIWTPKTVVKK